MSELLATALESLPHGPEFRFVDRLTALVAGKTGSGEFTLRSDEVFLRGHFPGQPMMPGVLLVEAGAQLAGTVAQCDPNIPPLAGLKLTAIRNAKILGTAIPGETIHLDARILGRMGNLIQAEVSARVAGRSLLKAEVVLSGEGPN
jgi:3-hydroxyacyl-[acyl-carrier-protein] dehydratase